MDGSRIRNKTVSSSLENDVLWTGSDIQNSDIVLHQSESLYNLHVLMYWFCADRAGGGLFSIIFGGYVPLTPPNPCSVPGQHLVEFSYLGRDCGATLRLGEAGGTLVTQYWGGHKTLFLTYSLKFLKFLSPPPPAPRSLLDLF